MNFDALKVARLTGKEPFHAGGDRLGFDVLSFWRWACSDINGNALRGLVAEYLVARAVGGDAGVRTEWDAYDVVTPGGLKIEVKCSAYLQSWKQPKLSAIKFDIRPTRGWTAATNTMAEVASRCADVYVFAVHAHQDKVTVDPLDVDQWEFNVLPRKVLDERVPTQKSIALSSLLKLGPVRVGFEGLGEAVTFRSDQRSRYALHSFGRGGSDDRGLRRKHPLTHTFFVSRSPRLPSWLPVSSVCRQRSSAPRRA